MSERKSLTIKLPAKILAEFDAIANQIGFETSEDLIKSYIKEVIISARIEQGTSSLRDAILRGSSDLGELNIKARSQPQVPKQ